MQVTPGTLKATSSVVSVEPSSTRITSAEGCRLVISLNNDSRPSASFFAGITMLNEFDIGFTVITNCIWHKHLWGYVHGIMDRKQQAGHALSRYKSVVFCSYG